MALKVIINADDLGRTKEVNRETFDLVAHRKVTSVSIIAGGRCVGEVAQAYGHFPRCSFGVHLYITDFAPLTQSQHLDRYLTEDGVFFNDARRYEYSMNLKKSILREWLAQVAYIRSMGIKVSHLDSHHHIHTFPPLFMVLKQLQKETGIVRVRLSLNCYAHQAKKSLLFKKWIYNTLLRIYVRTVTTSRFTSFGQFHRMLSLGSIPQMRSIELMVHPSAASYLDAESAKIYEQEISDLRTDWIARLPKDYRLIGYHEL